MSVECVIIDSGNGLSLVWHKAITRTHVFSELDTQAQKQMQDFLPSCKGWKGLSDNQIQPNLYNETGKVLLKTHKQAGKLIFLGTGQSLI